MEGEIVEKVTFEYHDKIVDLKTIESREFNGNTLGSFFKERSQLQLAVSNCEKPPRRFFCVLSLIFCGDRLLPPLSRAPLLERVEHVWLAAGCAV